MPDTRPDYHRPAGGPGGRLLLVFVDGVGLAPAGPANPLADGATPTLESWLGGPLVAENVGRRRGAVLAALDANLEVEGLPQSATGQTTLFTGVNAAREMGRHVSAFPGPRLRRLIRRHGLLGRLRQAGHPVTFANAYSRSFVERFRAREARRSVTTCLVQYAGLDFRLEGDLAEGRAVSWDISRELFAARTGADVAPVTPFEAGAHLAAVASRHRFTLFETFLTDLAGHGRVGVTPAAAIARVDDLLAGVAAAAPADLTVLLTSDHGNIEDSGGRLHTRNPVPLVAMGPAADRFAGLGSILQVAPAVEDCLAG